jgi:nucleoside-diphosphate-sugar epimerase
MVNVLIIGATGYIGQSLSQSLVRSGSHRVYGLARTPEKAQSLTRDEIIPILGSITENTNLLQAIDTYHINVVVDVAGANHESHVLLAELKKIGAARLEAAKSSGILAPKLGFIYCSGTWVHGSSNDPVNDLTPVDAPSSPNPPPKLVSWRPKLEREVLVSSDVLDVMVIRPALVYGRSGAIWSLYFDPLRKAAQSGTESISLPANAASRPGLIHVDDVASGFHAAIDKLPTIAGSGVYPVFDLATSQESMVDILGFAANSLGFKGKVELAGSGGEAFPEAMNTTANICSGRAKQILGWEPKRFGFVQNMDLFAEAFLAAKL